MYNATRNRSSDVRYIGPGLRVSSGCLVDKTMVAAVNDNEAIASVLKSNQEYSHHSAKDRCNAKMMLNF
ncbi:MAG TPA: hypothetical protein VFJ51_14080 [Nitrososphaeraceae archaeon]|nr:hypothetical protein [Nitrososphaeraceae archaeon]